MASRQAGIGIACMGAGLEFNRRAGSAVRRYRLLLKQGSLVNHYQPIVNLGTGRLDGVEILCRLQDGDRIIPPGEFLAGFGVPELDVLLFHSLAAGIATLQACSASHPDLRMSVNVHTAVRAHDGFAARLVAALRGGRMDPRRMTLKILEGHEFFDLKAEFTEIGILRKAGIEMALDDVGSEYSSLTR